MKVVRVRVSERTKTLLRTVAAIEGRPMIDVASEAVAQIVGEFMAKKRAVGLPATLVVKKMVGVIPHDCEGGAGCAFPDLPHIAKGDE